MKNLEIADLLDEIADLLDIQGVQWKPRAYRKAAINIRNLSEPIEEIYKKGGLKGLGEIPGVGEHIAKKIEEVLKTGKLKYYSKLKKQIPAGVKKLLEIQNIGPKTAKKIYDKFKIKDVKDLKKIIKSGKLRKVKGFAEKTEEEIMEGVKKKKTTRHLIGEVMPIAEEIKEGLEANRFVKKVVIAGSLGRMKETIGDVDILVVSGKPEKVVSQFVKFGKKTLAKGGTKASIMLENKIQVDLRVVEESSFGSAVQYFIGSKEHGIKTRQIAIKKGMKLSEYGLYKGSKKIAGRSEEEIYRRLGMQWVPYELRENRGEIEAAQKRKLPKLISLSDIKGDFHMHSNYSDGDNTILEMAQAAKKIGYKYIGICDHSEHLKIAGGVSEKERLKQMKEIDKVNNKISGIRVLKGIEVDIKKDGSLDCSDKLLKKLEVVVAAIHSGLGTDVTKRILTAMDNKHVTIIAHPTGRMLLQREGAKLDLAKIFAKAKERNIFLEINSQPNRLDLNDINSRSAKEKGVKMAIDSDAHSADSLNFMKYGVGTARRGWCEKKDIINTNTLSKVLGMIKR